MFRRLPAALLLAACSLSFAQPANVLTVTPPPPFKAKAGTTVEARLPMEMQAGYHVNSNMPLDQYLIPLRLTWDKGALKPTVVEFPTPVKEKYQAPGTPATTISVFTGKFEVVSKFKVPADAKQGPTTITGKLRYQACNNVMCLQPKNIDVALQVDITR